ncbi:MAG: TolC family protein, partial [Muribaculum sp.]|nr:TolC family protein [Muribaculum sp.]
MNRIYKISAILMLLMASACSGVRNLTSPEVAVPLSYADSVYCDSTCFADEEWWKLYTDTTLQGFIRKTLANNKDLLTASARIEEMRQLMGVETANLFPTVNGNVYANDETNDYAGVGMTHDREMGVKLSISWEMNLMGSMVWARRRGKANYLASVYDYRAMQVSLIAATAEAYFRLIALQNELAIVRRTEASRRESLRMAKIRFEGGLTSETVYQQ